MKPFLLFLFSFTGVTAFAQNDFFRDAPENSFNKNQKRVIIPSRYRTLSLDSGSLSAFLKTVPTENAVNHGTAPVIAIPMPAGGVTRFRIWESSVMDPKLAAQYPNIKTFTGQGIDDPSANIKLDWTPRGFHAMIISSLNGSVFIDPYSPGNVAEYISYNKIDFTRAGTYVELPVIKIPGKLNRPASPFNILAGTCIGTQLRTYRLALAATAEYTMSQGGTVAAALAAEATTMNRVNGIYEREVAIRMVLVPNNNLLIYTNSSTDPYSNNDGNAMLTENQNNITAVIGSNNYDIGHVLSTGGGGVAQLGVVCTGNAKAKGVTGSPVPSGDPFDIDYVAHEMGHQFGANHTFNSALDFCDGNGSSSSNAEPGSGSTIMAYAGICGSDNLQNNSDGQFHAISLNEITNYTLFGPGNNCAVKTSTGNNPPVVNAGPDYIIPKSTPFTLTGSGTDPNGNPLTYSWEQVDIGGSFGTWNLPAGNAPIFRSFIPVSTPVRYFPKLQNVIANTTAIGELMPSYARTINFRLTARDNRAGGGGVCFDEMAVTVSGTAGPFVVTFPNAAGITWYVNDFKTITWNPAGSDAAPVNCSNVKIELSTDGGLTYPVTIAGSTPNDGTEEIRVPANITTSARIRVMAVGNVFYDISNFNFSIQNSPATEFVFNNPVPVAVCGGSGVADLKTAALNGFATPINLSATGNPAGTTVAFSTNPVTPGATTTVRLNNTASLAAGTYNITVNGVAGAINKSRIISFLVTAVPPPPTSLTMPSNNLTGVSTLPAFSWVAVSSATSYTLDISTSNTFAPVTQTISSITNLPYFLSVPLAENTVYYWRVRSSNSCGTGAVSATGIFKTGISICKNSLDVPKTISAGAPSSITSTITIAPSSGVTIADLNVVGLTGSHSYVNDLTFTLTSPAGTSVLLFNQICTDQGGFDINLDDEAGNVSIPCPPTGSQTAQPQNPLSAFDGEASAGTWVLTVTDNADQDGGSLTGWGLSINNCNFKATPIATPWTQLCPTAASTALTSNITGNAYQWQVNTGSGFINIVNSGNYSGANTVTLQINNAPSSWYGYQYRCMVDGGSSTTFIIKFVNYWNGSVSNAWENASNWSCNTLPDAFTDAVINNGTVVVTANGICRSLAVNPGSSVTVNTGFKIAVMH